MLSPFVHQVPSIQSPFLNRRRGSLVGSGSVSPLALFAANEPGVWFDPSDLTTLFTDPAGTTPVTTPGQTVGLMLDKSRGLALGAELVANGDFPVNTTGWTAQSGATLSVDTGRLKVVTTSSGQGASQVLSGLVVGKTYKISIDVTVGGSDWNVLLGLAFGQGQGFLSGQKSTSQTYSQIFTCTNTAHNVLSLFSYGAGTTYYDNISVREIAGNHATQATLAARPTYAIEPAGGRRNLLTYSEDFRNTAGAGETRPWVHTNGTMPATQYLAPDGTLTAEKFTELAGGGNHAITRQGVGTATNGTTYTYSVHLKFDGRRYVVVDMSDGLTGGCFVYADLVGGSISQAVTKTGSWTTVGATMVAVGSDGWYRVSVSGTLGANNTVNPCIWFSNAATGIENPSYTGDGTSGVYVWGAQLEVSSAVTAYQRVGTTTYDVTEAGKASMSYLYFDGVNDSMTTTVDTNTIFGLPGTDPGYLLVGGVKYNTATAQASPWVRLAFCGDNTGYFGMWVHPSNGGEAGIYHWDTTSKTAERPYTVGSTAVFTGRRNPLEGAAGKIYASVNGVSSAGTDAVALNAASLTFAVGKQIGNTFLNGNIYSLIARGALTDAPTIASTETWVAGKTGIVI